LGETAFLEKPAYAGKFPKILANPQFCYTNLTGKALATAKKLPLPGKRTRAK